MKDVGEMWVRGRRNVQMKDAIQKSRGRNTSLCLKKKEDQRGKVQGSRRGDVFSQG